MSITFITGNENKHRELASILGDVNREDINLPEIQSLNPEEVIEEKLRVAQTLRKGTFIVEDTSLSCPGLGGLPGTFIKFFLERLGTEKLSALIRSTGEDRATATTVIGYADGNETIFFTGAVHGRIVPPRGKTAFGWDPIFQPNGHEKTFAEMGGKKHEISMRAAAAQQLKDHLTAQGR